MGILRRTSARLTQLREHLYRCKWRDKQAEETYWTLILARKTSPSINLKAVDSILKSYYNDDLLKAMNAAEGAMRHFGKKLSIALYVQPVEECPLGRMYAIQNFIPGEPMSHMYDEDPPIKSKTNQAYRDNFDRIFGEKEPEPMTFTVSQPSKHPDCAHGECEARGECTGRGPCPYFRVG